MKLYYIRVFGLLTFGDADHGGYDGLTISLYFPLQLFGLVGAIFFAEGMPPLEFGGGSLLRF
jgi:hypothetical protein